MFRPSIWRPCMACSYGKRGSAFVTVVTHHTGASVRVYVALVGFWTPGHRDRASAAFHADLGLVGSGQYLHFHESRLGIAPSRTKNVALRACIVPARRAQWFSLALIIGSVGTYFGTKCTVVHRRPLPPPTPPFSSTPLLSLFLFLLSQALALEYSSPREATFLLCHGPDTIVDDAGSTRTDTRNSGKVEPYEAMFQASVFVGQPMRGACAHHRR